MSALLKRVIKRVENEGFSNKIADAHHTLF